MSEPRKTKEVGHYDKLAREWMSAHRQKDWDTDVEALSHHPFASYRFCEEWIKKHVKRSDVFLDYGCGNGIHSILPAKLGARVIGIDLSSQSLKIARLRAKREGVKGNTSFVKMDCETLAFPDSSFDYIFDGGTFSSLDLQKVLSELERVLKPTGTLLAIETLGHNPLANFKRRLNKLLGIRTSWAVEHIFQMNDLELMQGYFGQINTHFFHFFSLFAFPSITLPGGKIVLSALEKIDSLFLRIPFLRRYAFKIVIICKNPKPK